MCIRDRSWADEGRLAAGGIVATIMSNLGLERFLSGKGIELARTKVGDRYVVEHMREHGYNVGGEQSGHIVLSDYGTTGDGLISALQLIAVMRGRGEPVSVAARKFDPVPQVLKNVRFAGGKPLERSDVRDVIDAGRARLGGGGRLVIRPSGTEPLIRVMAEGDDLSLVNAVVDDIVGVLKHQQAA